MGDFFEELVRARREGTAPPQVEERTREEPRPVSFAPSAIPGAWVCSSCFALVDHRLTAPHAGWHAETGT